MTYYNWMEWQRQHLLLFLLYMIRMGFHWTSDHSLETYYVHVLLNGRTLEHTSLHPSKHTHVHMYMCTYVHCYICIGTRVCMFVCSYICLFTLDIIRILSLYCLIYAGEATKSCLRVEMHLRVEITCEKIPALLSYKGLLTHIILWTVRCKCNHL